MPKLPEVLPGLIVTEGNTYNFNVDVFLQVYKEFSGIAAPIIQMQGNAAIAYLSCCAFCNMYAYAVSLLTAHRLARIYNIGAAYDANGMQDQSSTELGTSKSASTTSLSESSTPLGLVTGGDPFTSELATTRYGLILLQLIETLVPAADIATGASLGREIYTGPPWPVISPGY